MGVCARFQPLALKNVFLNAKDGGAKLLIFLSVAEVKLDF